MANQPREFFASVTGPTQDRHLFRSTAPKTFGTGSGTILKNSPVAFNTNVAAWTVWANAGTNGSNVIAGFIREDRLLDGTNTTQALVGLTGDVDYNDIVLPTGETDANLRIALKSGPRALGLMIKSLDSVH